MRQEASFFDDHDPRLIYIAKRLKESLALELLLTENGIDYGVEADQYRGGFLFPSSRTGAFFYVRPDSEAAARSLLTRHGYKPAEQTPERAPAK